MKPTSRSFTSTPPRAWLANLVRYSAVGLSFGVVLFIILGV